ncbi:MAG: DUF6624 domain-containing protein [Candidatus Paceibacterota bacterium]|jgi:hypothetical protein
MEKSYNTIRELLRTDQEDICLFKAGKISADEHTDRNLFTSNSFMDQMRKDGFCYKNSASQDIYKAFVTLSLHVSLSNMKWIFDTYIEKTTPYEVAPEDKALFIDKILILSGKPQIYGTQYKIDSNKKISFLPIEDEVNLDKRRSEAGLNHIETYMKIIGDHESLASKHFIL